MTLLLDVGGLQARAEVARGPLAPLAASLAGDLEAVLERPVYFPEDKALLSREGGRCARDGTLLEFDPFNRHEHRCRTCGTVYRGAMHERFWIYWYQLWLAERAVHAATLSALGLDERFASLAIQILDGYANRYASYPNVDNVLGPTRLFFSTYVESIWLLQICIATDLLASREPALAGRVRDRIIEPSRALIIAYDEGGSNRQVWNDVAILAASRSLGDVETAQRAVFGASGIAFHLANNLLPDGTWYEGENYHLFAHRGLWYGVTMAEQAGLELPHELIDRFHRGFSAPFATALPDFTLPSRRDSQYAISLRQWRIAEHCELGYARTEDPVLRGALSRMYQPDLPRNNTGRAFSSADAERNSQPSGLTRADLSWRALLFARPELPAGEASSPSSVLLDGQGIAVLRRDAATVYAALDYGHSGGGHGHPDRLNFLLATGETRWLDDFGTGSYVDPSLHWYRSTLAHNAPLFEGKSQTSAHGRLLAYEDRGGAGWVWARVHDLAPGVRATRTLVIMPTYALDIVAWSAPNAVTMDLPLHVDASVSSGASELTARIMAGGTGLEDGFEFLRDTAVQHAQPGASVIADVQRGAERLSLFATSTSTSEWWRATAPGAPGRGDHSFRIIRCQGATGDCRLVWSWGRDVATVGFGDDVIVTLTDGTRHVHRRSEEGWHVELHAGSARSSIDLGGMVARAAAPGVAVAEGVDTDALRVPSSGRPIMWSLGALAYRRSEESWTEAGRPSATVSVAWRNKTLEVVVDVPRSDRTFVPSHAVNVFDNEPPDVNGDGVELFMRTEHGLVGRMLVPEPGSDRVRVRPIDGWTAPLALDASWNATADGYRMRISAASDTPPAGLDIIVNEMPIGRVRRRGQLLLSGGAGEFVYLRGDRHEPSRLLSLIVADD